MTTHGCVHKGDGPGGIERFGIQPLRGWCFFHGAVGGSLRLFTYIPYGDVILLHHLGLWVTISPLGECRGEGDLNRGIHLYPAPWEFWRTGYTILLFCAEGEIR